MTDALAAKRQRKVESERASRLAQHGLTVEEYDHLLARQGGVCAICRRDRPGKKRRMLAVDHCHKTGRVRGLLCTHCNVTLGAVGDSVDGIQRFIDYLLGSAVPVPKRGRKARPRRLVIIRYVAPDGRRTKKGDRGAVAVRRLTRNFYLHLDGHEVSLGTADEAEAYRRVQSARSARFSPTGTPTEPPREGGI